MPSLYRQHGPITAAVARAFIAARKLSLTTVLASVWPDLFKDRAAFPPEKSEDTAWVRRRMIATDFYVVGFVTLEFAAAIALCCTSFHAVLAWIVSVLMVLRIVEIGQKGANVVLFDILTTRPDARVASTPRLVVLGFVNYAELIVAFGVLYAIRLGDLKNATKPIDAFHFSVVTQFTVGYGDIVPLRLARALVPAQVLLAFMITVLIVARAVASLPSIQSAIPSGKEKK